MTPKIPGLDRAYQFDLIGNRLRAASGTVDVNDLGATVYSPNAVNQYTAIDGLTPVYDDDGNMTSGPLPANLGSNSTLVWDGENRLISTTVNGGNTVTYIYDSQSRRITETVGSATTVYVYDGWNPVAEYSTTYALTKTYTWGLDLSGSMQGAGGVGGLLSVTDGTGTYFPTYDGNGNVSEYLDSAGAVEAHYEYDPFGRITVATGAKSADFSHRFSTKPLDSETGLYYYGYRYYDPVTGRWPSRDPIGEEGGVNLYGFVFNNTLIFFDDLGHAPQTQQEAQRKARNDANNQGRQENKNTITQAGINKRANLNNLTKGGAGEAIGEALNWVSDLQGLKTIFEVEEKCKSLAESKKKSEGWKSCRACCLHTYIAPRTPNGRFIRNDLTYLDYTVYEGQCKLSMRDDFKKELGGKFSQEYFLGNGEIVTPRMGQSVILDVK